MLLLLCILTWMIVLYLQVNCNSENVRLVAAILVAALYPNVVQVLSPQNTFQVASAGACRVTSHPYASFL